MKINNDKKSEIKVSITLNYNHYAKDSVNEYVEETQGHFSSIETKEKPTPTGIFDDPDAWLQFIIGISFKDFINEIIRDSIITLIIEKAIKPLFKSFIKKSKNNDISISLIQLKIDDIEIKIGGLKFSDIDIFEAIFQELAKNIDIMESKHKEKIISIELPLMLNPYSGNNKIIFYTKHPVIIPSKVAYTNVWKVWFSDTKYLYYSLKEKKYIDEDKLILSKHITLY